MPARGPEWRAFTFFFVLPHAAKGAGPGRSSKVRVVHVGPINHIKTFNDLLLMRALAAGLILLLVAFAGCTEERPAEPLTPAPGQKYGEVLADDDPLSAYTWLGTNLIYDELEAPAVASGTAWTYAAQGAWALTQELQVIAVSTDEGYTFGAAAKEQLVNTAIWPMDPWYGPLDAGLNPVGGAAMFAWPLHDGQMFDRQGMAMSVIADLIETPDGAYPGYRFEGSTDQVTLRYTYVPEIGYLTSYWYGTSEGSEPWIALELSAIGSAETAIWFDGGEPFGLGSEDNPLGVGPNVTALSYEVPTGYDDLVLAGLGTKGAGASARPLVGPDGPPYAYEDAAGFWDWQVAMIPATAGPWLLEAHTTGDGWAYFEGVPVRWVDLEA